MKAGIANETATVAAEIAHKCGNDTPSKHFVAGNLNQVNSI